MLLSRRCLYSKRIMRPELLAALIAVESGGNDHARGRHGELGALQVRPCVVVDVNRVAGTAFRWSEMTNRVTAKTVCESYLAYWGARIGRPPTDRDLAMIWHRGPNGWRKPGGEYWKRVRARMGVSVAGGTDPRQ